MPNVTGRTSTTSIQTPRTPDTERPSTVTVAPGDSLRKIAGRLGVSVEALAQANTRQFPQLATDHNRIQVGWKLAVPQGTATQTPPNGGWSAPTAPTAQQPSQPLSESNRAQGLGARLAAGGIQSLDRAMKAHAESLERTGVGVYYGDKSSFAELSPEGRAEWLSQNVKPGQTAPAKLKESSCIAWAFEHVGAAYAAAGKADRWKTIYSTVTRNGSKGTDLAKELQKDGWQAVYWNPDTKKPSDGDNEHSFSATQVTRGNGYYGVKVDASVTNYRPTDGGPTTQDMSGIEKLKEVPFWFGLARGGKHTFVGRGNTVNEFHWREQPSSTKPFSEKPMEGYAWNSGLIMVPPGSWPTGRP